MLDFPILDSIPNITLYPLFTVTPVLDFLGPVNPNFMHSDHSIATKNNPTRPRYGSQNTPATMKNRLV